MIIRFVNEVTDVALTSYPFYLRIESLQIRRMSKIKLFLSREILGNLYESIESHPLNLHFLHYTMFPGQKRFAQEFFVTLHIVDHYLHDPEDIRGMAAGRM